MRRPPFLSKKPRRVSRPAGAKGTVIIFGGGVYVAENTSRGASVELSAFSGQPRVPNECESHSLGEEEQRNDRALGFSRERGICSSRRRSAAPVSIGRSRPGDFIVKKGRREPFLTVSGGLRKLRRPPAEAPRIYLRGSYLQGGQAIALVEAHTRAFDCPVLPGAA